MIDKTIIHRLSRDIFRRSEGVSDHHLMHPEREWSIGILCLITLLGIGIYWTWYEHNRFTKISTTEPSPTPSTASVYREQEVAHAIQTWSERVSSYEEIKTELKSLTPAPQLFTDTPVTSGSSTATSTEPELSNEIPPAIETPTTPTL